MVEHKRQNELLDHTKCVQISVTPEKAFFTPRADFGNLTSQRIIVFAGIHVWIFANYQRLICTAIWTRVSGFRQ